MDLDEELMMLMEGGETSKRKKSSKSKSRASGDKPKKKRPAAAEEDSASDMDMSASDSDAGPVGRDGEEDEDEDEFPLEGKYRDAADRAEILSMTELDREQILGERAEVIGKAREKRELKRMVNAKRLAEGGEDRRETGRERKTTGTTNEKRETLEKLKKQRAEKGKKRERREKDDDDYDDAPSSPPRKRHDAYTDDEDSEEGELDFPSSSRYSSSNRDRDHKSSKSAVSNKVKDGDVIGPTLLNDIVLSRAKLAKLCAAPWFGEWAKGGWVRIAVGADHGQPVYRVAQIDGVKENPSSSYKVEGVKTNIELLCRIANSAVKGWPLTNISSSPVETKEFLRLEADLRAADMSLPTVGEHKKLVAQLASRTEYIMSEADLQANLAKKGNYANAVQGKAKLMIRLAHAKSINDSEQIAAIQADLAKYDVPPPSSDKVETEAERMKRVNERNRAVNRKEIKEAESRGVDERRKQAEALARGDSGVKVDPSARVKTMTRLKYDRDTPTGSRQSTPAPGNGSPSSGLVTPPVTEVPKAKVSRFSEVAKSVEIDLDLDF